MTIAVDTNVIVRFLVEDDAAQASLARAVLVQPCFVPATVLIESEWVLRAFYGWPRVAIADAMAALIDLPDLVADPPGVRWAIDRFKAGADFADMIHLASAEGATRFATFDRTVARHAGADSPIAVETLS